jgi:PTS system nitrogen regulatory IIA component
MEMTDLVEPDRVIAGLRTRDKVQLLNELSRRAALMIGFDVQTVAGALTKREALGSTGIGYGIAIPHARIDGLQHIFGLFARLDHAVDFAAIDGQPVDLAFLLLIPTDAGHDHLAALACVSRRLRDPDVAQALRAAVDRRTLFDRLVGETP